MRKLKLVMATLALGSLTGLATAGEAPTLRLAETKASATTNQQLADELAAALKASGLKGYAIDIEVHGGVVTLTGAIADSAQHAQLLNVARRHAGVVAVNDAIQVRDPQRIIATNFQEPRTLPVADTKVEGRVLEPMPVQSFAGGIMPYSDAPVMPPYAWPAYTPYNNFASLAYQTQYPAGAWPFIGPPHPYPMIPSGWRSVTLRWSKGYWWLKFRAI